MNEPAPRSLRTLQQWLQSVITHPNGVTAGIVDAQQAISLTPDQIESVVPASTQLDAISKIEVYGNAYYARLIECLGEEFPAVKAALTANTFDSFAFSYLQQFPSTSYTLSDLGGNFAEFLDRTKPTDAEEHGWANFLIDLARLEWHYSEIFNGPRNRNDRRAHSRDVAVDHSRAICFLPISSRPLRATRSVSLPGPRIRDGRP